MFINYRPFYVFILSLCVCVFLLLLDIWLYAINLALGISSLSWSNHQSFTSGHFFLGQEPRIIIQLLNYAKRW